MVELADIFHQHGSQYRAKFGDRMLPSHRQAMRATERCRTPALGGHVYFCEQCEESAYVYHSCRNRHCPQCQNGNAQHWLEKQQDLLLPVPYFLVTFTLPGDLRGVARSHQKLVYDLLFRTSAEAMPHLARDPRFVGGQLGMVGVLHTWGRNLSYHPHVHYLVPAGGLPPDGQTWQSTRKNFLLPVKALSKIFRAKFRDGLRKRACFADVPAALWQQEWVVHCQPVGNGVSALKYLAPYIFRVAISNNRILKPTIRQMIQRPIPSCSVPPAAGSCSDDPSSVPRDAALLERLSAAGEEITALPSRAQSMVPGVLSSACLGTEKTLPSGRSSG